MPEPLPSYAIVSPVRDEGEFVAGTIESIVAQTHRPAEWIIVDDGSTDDTRRIAEGFAAEHDWIRVVAGEQRHRRARGKPIVEAFNRGREQLRKRPDFVVKLDGDLFVPSHYFAWVAETFARDPRAGVVSGRGHVFDGSAWVPERAASHNTLGYVKSYRSDCLDAIGGLRPSMGWDGIDEYGARARGWNVRVLTEVGVLHFKQRGSRQSWWRARWEEGVGNAYMGYRPAFLAVRAAYRTVVEYPPIAGGLVLALGYAWSRLRGRPTIDDAAAVAELRAEQGRRLRALVRGRTELPAPPLPDRGPAFWNAARARESSGVPQAPPPTS
jgi:poly-beta-1,6-N-acetyl-D-glucosamine synthase